MCIWCINMQTRQAVGLNLQRGREGAALTEKGAVSDSCNELNCMCNCCGTHGHSRQWAQTFDENAKEQHRQKTSCKR
jgi:hypothetical protein